MESKQNSGFSQRNKDSLNLSIESTICQLTLFQDYCICKTYHAILSETCLSWNFSCFWPGIHQRTGSCQYWIVNFAEFDSVEVFNIISWTLAILYFTWRPFWFGIKIIQLRNNFRGTSVLRGSLRKVSIFVVKLLLIKCRIANTFDSKDTAFDHKTFLRVLFQT